MTQTARPWYRARTLRALGAAVQGGRKATGRSQEEFAIAISSSRPTVSRLERGVPVSTEVLLDALTAAGYEILVVPRGSDVRVETGR